MSRNINQRTLYCKRRHSVTKLVNATPGILATDASCDLYYHTSMQQSELRSEKKGAKNLRAQHLQQNLHTCSKSDLPQSDNKWVNRIFTQYSTPAAPPRKEKQPPTPAAPPRPPPVHTPARPGAGLTSTDRPANPPTVPPSSRRQTPRHPPSFPSADTRTHQNIGFVEQGAWKKVAPLFNGATRHSIVCIKAVVKWLTEPKLTV